MMAMTMVGLKAGVKVNKMAVGMAVLKVVHSVAL
jgi:hypothetical protein